MNLQFNLLNEKTSVNELDCDGEDLFLRNFALLFQRRHFGVTVILFHCRITLSVWCNRLNMLQIIFRDSLIS